MNNIIQFPTVKKNSTVEIALGNGRSLTKLIAVGYEEVALKAMRDKYGHENVIFRDRYGRLI